MRNTPTKSRLLLVYKPAAMALFLLVLMQTSCGSNSTQPANSSVRSDNVNVSPSPLARATPTPEKRDDQTALNLARVIHRWCDYKEEAYLETGLNLSWAWRRKFPTDPAYYPDGVDKLINRLKQVPDFQQKEQIKHLHNGYFNPDTGIKTAGDLYDFIQLNRDFPTGNKVSIHR